MNVLSKFAALGALMLIAACSNNDPSALGGGAGGSGAIQPGSPSDPRSPAYFQQTVGDRVLFAVDQSTLSPQAQTVLQGQAEWLLANTDYTATIEGHADEQGTREYNLALGARRANAAREYLISRGVAGNRIQTISYGKERPIEICSTEECYSKNRRAVTVLTGSTLG
ncbi:peptidoglycan-associated lipoprotein Pal [Ruegeria arenilitoris]|uniref:peptidoglycan-associated lipoprotein Pal n=1 Tax=Ruegeria arenilitoris TaxID=1173585 RepID=UPI001479B86F|nr:peptidoglycan-associated lipoprotein Pal [Ruegeria arenilitoris]